MVIAARTGWQSARLFQRTRLLFDAPGRARPLARIAPLCLFAALMMPSVGAGADGLAQPALPEPLTLEAALGQALDYNYAVRAAMARVRERDGEVVHAARPVPTNPVLGLETARRNGSDDTSTDIAIRISQELWMGGRRGLQREAAQARTDAARGQLDFLRTSVAARTRRAFLQLLLARESVRTAQRMVELAREVQTYARRRLEAGEATRLEINAAAIGLGQAEAELVQARRERARAHLALAELLAVDPARSFEVAGRLRPAALRLAEQDTLLRRSLQRRRDLAAAAQAVLSARKELRLAERQLIPNLTVMGFYEQEESADIAGVGLSIPLPVLHRYSGERTAAGARLQQAQIERDALQLQVGREVLQAVTDYRAARERVEVFSGRMLEAAEENLRLIRKAFAAGKVGAPAITSAQDNLLVVRRTYLDALSELIAAGTALERATGGLVRMAQGAEPSHEEQQR